jgi:hypothetical protein
VGEALRVHVAREVAGGAGAQGGEQLALVELAGHDHDGALGQPRADLAQRPEAMAGDVDVDDARSRPVLHRRTDRGGGVGHHRAEAEAARGERRAELPPDERAVAGQEHERRRRPSAQGRGHRMALDLRSSVRLVQVRLIPGGNGGRDQGRVRSHHQRIERPAQAGVDVLDAYTAREAPAPSRRLHSA